MVKDLCFEIIQTCPNHCLFCSSCSTIDQTEYIDFGLFQKTIDHLMKLGGIEELSISGGEPFLHPDLFRMIGYAKEKGIRTVLFTSGVTRREKLSEDDYQYQLTQIRKHFEHYIEQGMPREEAESYLQKQKQILDYYNDQEFSEITRYDFERLKQLGLDKLVFDFQAWDREIYEQMMGSKYSFDYITLSMIKASVVGFELDAHFIPTKYNYKQLPDLIEMLNVIQFSTLSILNFVPQGRGLDHQTELQLSDVEMQEFVEIYQKWKDSFHGNIRVGIPLLKEDVHQCTAGFSKLVIKYDGTVLPCPAFKEFDVNQLHDLGIKTPNIKQDLDQVIVTEGSYARPLCKQLYQFHRTLK